MNIDAENFERDLYDGRLRDQLTEELATGFRLMQEKGDPLPLPTWYASKITEIIHASLPEPPNATMAWELYHEVLEACETARKRVEAQD